MYNTRINKEVKKLTENKDQELGIYKQFKDNHTFYAYIKGPSDSPFEDGYFKLFVHLPDDYPFSPPYMKFMTKVYHPNISSQTGAICLDILKDKWTAAMSIESALISIQALLTAAVPDDPQDYPVAVVYMEDRKKYNETAKEWTDLYAAKAEKENQAEAEQENQAEAEQENQADSKKENKTNGKTDDEKLVHRIEELLETYREEDVIKQLSANIWDKERLKNILDQSYRFNFN